MSTTILLVIGVPVLVIGVAAIAWMLPEALKRKKPTSSVTKAAPDRSVPRKENRPNGALAALAEAGLLTKERAEPEPGGLMAGLVQSGLAETQQKESKTETMGPTMFDAERLIVRCDVAEVRIEVCDRESGIGFTVTGTPESIALVSAVVKDGALTVSETPVSQDGSTVTIKGDLNIRGGFNLDFNRLFDIAKVMGRRPPEVTISVPVGTPVEVSAEGSGSVVIGDIGAPAVLDASGDGYIEAGAVTDAEIRNNSDCNIRVRRVDGHLKAALYGSGGLEIEDGTLDSLDLHNAGESEFSFGGLTKGPATVRTDSEYSTFIGGIECDADHVVDIEVNAGGDVQISHIECHLKAVLGGSGNLELREGTLASLDLHNAGEAEFSFDGRVFGPATVRNDSDCQCWLGSIECDADHVVEIEVNAEGKVRANEIDGHLKAVLNGSGDLEISGGTLASLDLHNAGEAEFSFGGRILGPTIIRSDSEYDTFVEGIECDDDHVVDIEVNAEGKVHVRRMDGHLKAALNSTGNLEIDEGILTGLDLYNGGEAEFSFGGQVNGPATVRTDSEYSTFVGGIECDADHVVDIEVNGEGDVNVNHMEGRLKAALNSTGGLHIDGGVLSELKLESNDEGEFSFGGEASGVDINTTGYGDAYVETIVGPHYINSSGEGSVSFGSRIKS